MEALANRKAKEWFEQLEIMDLIYLASRDDLEAVRELLKIWVKYSHRDHTSGKRYIAEKLGMQGFQTRKDGRMMWNTNQCGVCKWNHSIYMTQYNQQIQDKLTTQLTIVLSGTFVVWPCMCLNAEPFKPEDFEKIFRNVFVKARENILNFESLYLKRSQLTPAYKGIDFNIEDIKYEQKAKELAIDMAYLEMLLKRTQMSDNLRKALAEANFPVELENLISGYI